jgi:hypothetical protein
VFDRALCHGTVILLVFVTLTTFPWFGNRSRTPQSAPDALDAMHGTRKSKESEVRTRPASQGRSISTAEPLTRTEYTGTASPGDTRQAPVARTKS